MIIDIALHNKEHGFLLPLLDYSLEMACKLESDEIRLNCKNLSLTKLLTKVSTKLVVIVGQLSFYIFQSIVNKVNKLSTKHISNK